MLRISGLDVKGRLSGISATVNKGRFLHVLGPNGAGKSTLLSAVAGLIATDNGKIEIAGRAITKYAANELAQFRCYQMQGQMTHFSLTVNESIHLFSGKQRIPNALEEALEIADFAHRPLMSLSGGEAKRVQIVRCLMQIWPAINQGTGLILLDEPTQGLDYRHQHLLMDFLQGLCENGNTVLMSHHDLNLAWQFSNQVWLLKGGTLQYEGLPEKTMTPINLQSVFDCNVQRLDAGNSRSLFQTYLDKV